MPDVFSLDKKIAVITGGASGLGFAAAQLFARQGATVVLLSRNGEKGARAVELLVSEGILATHFAADVRDLAAVEAAIRSIERGWGRIDILLNNAGSVVRKAIHETSPAEWSGVMDTSVTGAFHCVRSCLPGMIERRRGVILNTSSYLALHGGFGTTPAYAAAKAALLGLTRSLAVRHGPEGIRVNAILPALIPTDMNREVIALGSDPKGREQELSARYPLRRLGTPADFAHAALFLVSDEASWITGQCLYLDGGLTAV